MMTKLCLALAIFCLAFVLPSRAFNWETATSKGREYVTLHSFCQFYAMGYQVPSGNDRFTSRNAQGHSVSFKIGSSDAYIDGVHYVLSFPIEGGDHDWLVSRMDVIKLFEPVFRPDEISGRHSIRGVVIDAGHGGSDNGAGSRFGNEKTYTLDTANRLDGILRNAGLKTVFTRRTDTFVDLYERAHIASLYPDYAFVSIHYNSASEEARGLETYCLSPRGAASTSSAYLTRGDIQKLTGNDNDTQNILLASLVHSEVIKLNPGDATADRGVKRARFVVIKANVLPAILVEGGFLSNHMEAARVNQSDYRQRLAQAIARGVIRFINAEGDRHMSLPSDGGGPAPRAVAATPPAPTGMAHDSANGKAASPAATPAKPGTTAPSPKATPVANTSPSATTHGKSKKGKKTAAAATPTPAPAATPTPAPSPAPAAPSAPTPSASTVTQSAPDAKPSSSSSSGSLGLSDPIPPTPSPGADKAPAEPDEPPTVSSPSTASAGTNASSAHEP